MKTNKGVSFNLGDIVLYQVSDCDLILYLNTGDICKLWSSKENEEKVITSMKQILSYKLHNDKVEVIYDDNTVVLFARECEGEIERIFNAQQLAKKKVEEGKKETTIAHYREMPKTQCNLAFDYNKGYGIEQDYVSAIKWLSEEVKKDNTEAQKILGDMYYYGYGVKQDLKRAASLYRRAAEHGNAEAQYLIAEMNYYGLGTDKDRISAVRWYKKAADCGNAKAREAIEELAEELSIIAKQDPIAEIREKVVEEYSKKPKSVVELAKEGNVESQKELADKYLKYKNYQEAAKWYRNAADQGDAEAQYMIGVMYHKGCGLEHSDKLAARWYKKAADQGHVIAQNDLGLFYLDGIGVEQDYEKAVEMLTLAANQNNISAQYNLGTMYYDGLGVQQDVNEAKTWLTKAADQGDIVAQSLLDEIKGNIK